MSKLMEQVKDKRIAEIKERLSKATLDRWEAVLLNDLTRNKTYVKGANFGNIDPYTLDEYLYQRLETQQEIHNKATFIAHAPEDIAYLLAEVERLKAALQRIVDDFMPYSPQQFELALDEIREFAQEAIEEGEHEQG